MVYTMQSIEEGSPGDSEIVQDSKKVNREHHKSSGKEGKQKVRRHTTNKRPRELLFMRSINGEEAKTEDKVRGHNTLVYPYERIPMSSQTWIRLTYSVVTRVTTKMDLDYSIEYRYS